MLHIMNALLYFDDILGTFINNLWTEICQWTSVFYVIICSYIACPNEQAALYFPKGDQCLALVYQQPQANSLNGTLVTPGTLRCLWIVLINSDWHISN
jgi:hypothetical protein